MSVLLLSMLFYGRNTGPNLIFECKKSLVEVYERNGLGITVRIDSPNILSNAESMNMITIFAVLLVGFAVGLRTFTGPAVVAWAAYLSCINLASTSLSFMASPIAVGLLTSGALGEYVYDVSSIARSRTAAGPLTARVLPGPFPRA